MAQKRHNGLCPYFCLGKSCSPALILMPDTSVPPCVPLVPFKLLPQWCCWSSEGGHLNKLVRGPLRGMAKESSSFFLTDSNSADFYSQKLWGLLFLALVTWAEGLVWGWDPSLPRYPSRIFIYHTWV